MHGMNRDEEHAPRVQRRTAYEDPRYEMDVPNAAPRRRRSQAARMQTRDDDPRDNATFTREPAYQTQRDGKNRPQLPERPRMRQFADDLDGEDNYRPPRKQNQYESAGPRENSQTYSRRARPADDTDDDLYEEYKRKKARKSRPVKRIFIVLLILLFVGGAAFITLNQDIRYQIQPFVQMLFERISGPSPTALPTAEPTPAPTEEPLPPLALAAVNEFSVIQEGEIQINDMVQFRIETSVLTDRIHIIDGNSQTLIQIVGEENYIDTENGRVWNVMYTFISPYEGVLEVIPGNQSGWNDVGGSQIDIAVVDPRMGTMEGAAGLQGAGGDFAVQVSQTQPGLINLESQIYVKGELADTFSRENAALIGAAGDYSASAADRNGMNGILTFRGDNLRQNAAFGKVEPIQKTLEKVWEVNVGVPGDGGRMWNVQPVIAQWPQVFREAMNLLDGKQTKSLFREVVFASNDGRVYFLDLEDGSPTREKVTFSNPTTAMLSAPSIYPSGVPLVFVGTGDPAYLAEDLQSTGMYMYNCMNGKTLLLGRGSNEKAKSGDATFITSPLIDRDTGVMIIAGGNGILYTSYFGIEIDQSTLIPEIVTPTTEMLITEPQSDRSDAATIFSEYAVYNNIVYIATQGGVLQAIDINSLQTVWALELGQETDAAISIDPEASGTASVYAVSRPDTNGKSHVRRIDALTGSVQWDIEIGGAVSASMLVGANALSDLVYVAAEEPSVLYALSKADGQLRWARSLKTGRASAPIALYSEDGTGYVVHGDEGAVFLLDGVSGGEYASVEVEGGVVGSPAAFDDMIALATSAGKLYGIQVK